MSNFETLNRPVKECMEQMLVQLKGNELDYPIVEIIGWEYSNGKITYKTIYLHDAKYKKYYRFNASDLVYSGFEIHNEQNHERFDVSGNLIFEYDGEDTLKSEYPYARKYIKKDAAGRATGYQSYLLYGEKIDIFDSGSEIFGTWLKTNNYPGDVIELYKEMYSTFSIYPMFFADKGDGTYGFYQCFIPLQVFNEI